jgi:hypothetical protein
MTTIVLGVLLLAVIAAWLYRERENAKERAALADRIQAPAAFQMAAMDRAWPQPVALDGPLEAPDAPPPPHHYDLSIDALLEDK